MCQNGPCVPNGPGMANGLKLGMKSSQVHSESSDEPLYKRVPKDGLENKLYECQWVTKEQSQGKRETQGRN